VSSRTIAAYRDAFRLLLAWFDQKLHKHPVQLSLTDLDVTRITAFLEHLETDRHNTIRSRNATSGTIRGVLALPKKRFERPLLGYLTREEIEALLRWIYCRVQFRLNRNRQHQNISDGRFNGPWWAGSGGCIPPLR
jgi:hypothetical protein